MEFIGGECLAITKAIILINSLGDSDFVQKMPRGGRGSKTIVWLPTRKIGRFI